MSNSNINWYPAPPVPWHLKYPNPATKPAYTYKRNRVGCLLCDIFNAPKRCISIIITSHHAKAVKVEYFCRRAHKLGGVKIRASRRGTINYTVVRYYSNQNVRRFKRITRNVK